jgi:hypothetical protein
MYVQLPTVEGAGVAKHGTFIFGTNVKDGDTAVRRPGEMVVEDDDSAVPILDVGVDSVVCVTRCDARRGKCIDEVTPLFESLCHPAHVVLATSR